MHGGNPQTIINDTVSLYLPDYERYFDVVFYHFLVEIAVVVSLIAEKKYFQITLA